MATTRGLLVLTVIAAALAVVWIADPGDGPPPTHSRLLVPELAAGIDAAGVSAITWERPGEPAVRVVREPAGGYAFAGALAEAGEGGGQDDGDVAAVSVVDDAAVADVLGTLATLAYRRRVSGAEAASPERGLDAPRLRLVVERAAGPAIEIALGASIEPLDQVWMRRGGVRHAYTIAGHDARVLDRRAGDLARRVVFAPGSIRYGDGATAVAIRAGHDALLLSGRPLAVHLDGLAGAMQIEPLALQELARDVESLRLVRVLGAGDGGGVSDDGAAATGDGESAATWVRVSGGEIAALVERGPCPGQPALRRVATSAGPGCASAAAIAAVARWTVDPRALLDTRLLGRGVDWRRATTAVAEIGVRQADSPTLRLVARGGGWTMTSAAATGERDATGEGDATADADAAADAADAAVAADAEALGAWLDALDRAPAGSFTEDRPTRVAVAVDIRYRDGARIRVHIGPGPGPGPGSTWLGHRDGEPLSLVLDAARVASMQAALTSPPLSVRLRDRQIWTFEPTALRVATARVRGAVVAAVTRGPLVDDWSADAPAGARADPAALDRLRRAASGLRALRFVAADAAAVHGLDPPRRRVILGLDPDPLSGAPRQLALALGRRVRGPDGADTCLAQRIGEPGQPDSPVFALDGATCDALSGPWLVGK